MFKRKTLVLLLIIMLLSLLTGYMLYPHARQLFLTYTGYSRRNGTPGAEKSLNNVKVKEKNTEAQAMKKNTNSDRKYNGKYISAVLPDTWTIAEYFNGNGSGMLVQGATYQGLTGVEILNSSHVVVFKMEAVNGIGGVDACSEYYKFSDDNPQYYNQVLSDAQAVGMNVNIVDLSNKQYSEFTFLGKHFRRIGSSLYWDTQSGNNTFEAACGIAAHVIQFPSLSFTADGETSHGYQISIKNNPSETDLSTLDHVLSTVQTL